MKASKFLIATGVSILLFSCNNDPKQDETDTETADSAVVEQPDTSGMEDFTYILPSPLKIASLYQKSGVKYLEGLTSPADNHSKYSGALPQALNLGVYSADLAYCILNDQTQAAMNYLKAIKVLSDGLGMSSVFETQGIIQRFEKNMSNKDSLGYIVSDLYSESDVFLEENEKKFESVMIFTGGWTESFYIASTLATKEKKDAITNRLGEQKLILDKLVPMLSRLKRDEPQFNELVQGLQELKGIMDNLEGIKSQNIEENGLSEVKMSEAELKSVNDKVKEIRTKLTKV